MAVFQQVGVHYTPCRYYPAGHMYLNTLWGFLCRSSPTTVECTWRKKLTWTSRAEHTRHVKGLVQLWSSSNVESCLFRTSKLPKHCFIQQSFQWFKWISLAGKSFPTQPPSWQTDTQMEWCLGQPVPSSLVGSILWCIGILYHSTLKSM